MKKLFGYDSINKKTVDVIREGPSGHWEGKIKIWWDEDGEYYYGYKYFKRGNISNIPKSSSIENISILYNYGPGVRGTNAQRLVSPI